ncbi:MAG: hypothetical protein M1831_001947 [Alyxoria varia]|nr:MAG: hypothetical protein M1831_001947 [Alyxoria varia]
MTTQKSTITTTTTTTTTNGHHPSSSSRILHDLQTLGYTVIPRALSPSQVSHIHAVATNATDGARAGMWPHVRTLPKEFPPWPQTKEGASSETEPEIWGVQHLMHPDLPGHEEFAKVYFGDEVLGPVKEILGVGGKLSGSEDAEGQEVGDERLVMELFNLLVRPDMDFELRWHRDAVPFDGVGVEEEEKRLGLEIVEDDHGNDIEAASKINEDERRKSQKRPHKRKIRRPFHAQYNVALEPDSSLILVPGSHLRSRTAQERDIISKDPYAEDLPGMKAVQLEPGDIAFYDNNIIHRGVYKADTPRLTLHGSVGDVQGGTGRARNVLQHAVGDWIDRCNFQEVEDEKLRRRAESMKARLVDLGREAGADGTRALHSS